MSESQTPRQSGARERAQNVTVTTPTEIHLYPWAWMQRATLNCSASELGIVFPGRHVILRGRNLPKLLSEIAAGTVSEIVQNGIGGHAPPDARSWSVDTIRVLDPDDSDADGNE